MKLRGITILASVALLCSCATENRVEQNQTPYVSHFGYLTPEQAPGMFKWVDVQKKIAEDNYKYPVYNLKGVELLKAVDADVNKVKYVSDQQNYGVTDYWATPREFFKNGGDCEDYAVAKYEILKHNGISVDDLQIVVGYDFVHHYYHTILYATVDGQTYVLTNGDHGLLFRAEDFNIFKPIYAINDKQMWRF